MNEEEAQLEESRDVVISAIAQTMVIYGVTPSVGRIYGLLYFSDRPLSMDEIKEQVAMSKGSVSNGLRELMDTEMVSKVWKKGQRKDHFIAEKDFFKNYLNFFAKKLRQERSVLLKATEKARPDLLELRNNTESEELQEQIDQDLERISETTDYLDWTLRLAYAMETRDIFDYFPKVRSDSGESHE
ncbi:GbsR/MarR family transcriptional regulator [Tuberibacillus sp. Marseille-P3662]|uniref:GbsR/MarR family transcriptional regulator n=1 Tax=Tuberibacillus sp. Marseille-P3662 TaxID=1965358 RepID=UPI000A1CC456|nr:transcriptional regulator [Tuberibacillus sp. Marseille-P3662]